jgi:hypothetical protein
VQHTLFVRWRVAPAASPLVVRHCPRCERERPFASSGRFRVNAQKKRLDAWLVYRCCHCERTWNYPVIERQVVDTIAPGYLQRLHANCPDLAAAFAGDIARLRRFARGVEAGSLRLEKHKLEGSEAAGELRILLQLATPLASRLDRLLAVHLNQSRSCVATWRSSGVLAAEPAGMKVREGQVVAIALERLEPRQRRLVVRGALGP